MGDDEKTNPPKLSRLTRVRCLSCDATYVKPSAGGTVSANPGCPECGYVGWVVDRRAFTMDAEQRRSVEDRLRRRIG